MSMYKGKTVVISGNVNETGLAIAKPYAMAGANIILLIDSRESWHHDTWEELKTIHPQIVLQHISMSEENTVQQAVNSAVLTFGNNVDILVNNLGAVIEVDTGHLHPQQFDLMYSLNVRNAFMLSKICHPFLKKSTNPHIINISPPLDIDREWFRDHLAFSMSTFSMSMCTIGMSAEFKKDGIAVNSIWPVTDEGESFADAVFALGQKKSRECSGNFYTH